MRSLKLSMLVILAAALPNFAFAQTAAEMAATPSKRMNYVNSLIYNAIVEKPVWSKDVTYVSTESLRKSFVKTHEGIICTAMIYDFPTAYRINEYNCEVPGMQMAYGHIFLRGTAARFIYDELHQIFKSGSNLYGDDLQITIDGIGAAKLKYDQGMTVEVPNSGGIRDLTVIHCVSPTDGGIESQAGGEFQDAVDKKILPASLNVYTCEVSLQR